MYVYVWPQARTSAYSHVPIHPARTRTYQNVRGRTGTYRRERARFGHTGTFRHVPARHVPARTGTARTRMYRHVPVRIGTYRDFRACTGTYGCVMGNGHVFRLCLETCLFAGQQRAYFYLFNLRKDVGLALCLRAAAAFLFYLLQHACCATSASWFYVWQCACMPTASSLFLFLPAACLFEFPKRATLVWHCACELLQSACFTCDSIRVAILQRPCFMFGNVFACDLQLLVPAACLFDFSQRALFLHLALCLRAPAACLFLLLQHSCFHPAASLSAVSLCSLPCGHVQCACAVRRERIVCAMCRCNLQFARAVCNARSRWLCIRCVACARAV